jgi:hypothetical protein
LFEGLDGVLVVGGDEDDLGQRPFVVIAFTVGAGSWAMRRAASTPDRPGMRMSRKTTSGWCCATRSTASRPFLASPTICSSGQTSVRRAFNWSRISRSSSAITPRTGAAAEGEVVLLMRPS